MTTEIKNTIDHLKFKKPLPQFFTRTEKRLLHTPGVYFAEVKNDFQNGNKKSKAPIGMIDAPTQKISDSTLDILNIKPDDRTKGSIYYAVDSTAQTDISKPCLCPKKAKKNLKWKIIINKHANRKTT